MSASLLRETKYLAEPPAAATEAGVFEGYASLFGVADLGKDVVAPGAFAESLARRGAAGVRMLWQHDPAEPIGRWLSIVEDARGLRVRGRLNLAVARARELHALMREGAVDGLSIGFRVERARADKRAGLRRLERVDLWEISLVTFPMLPGARVSGVKGGPTLHEGRRPDPSLEGRADSAARPSRVGTRRTRVEQTPSSTRLRPIPTPDLRRYAASARPSPPGRDRAPLALAIRRAAARLFTV